MRPPPDPTRQTNAVIRCLNLIQAMSTMRWFAYRMPGRNVPGSPVWTTRAAQRARRDVTPDFHAECGVALCHMMQITTVMRLRLGGIVGSPTNALTYALGKLTRTGPG